MPKVYSFNLRSRSSVDKDRAFREQELDHIRYLLDPGNKNAREVRRLHPEVYDRIYPDLEELTLEDSMADSTDAEATGQQTPGTSNTTGQTNRQSKSFTSTSSRDKGKAAAGNQQDNNPDQQGESEDRPAAPPRTAGNTNTSEQTGSNKQPQDGNRPPNNPPRTPGVNQHGNGANQTGRQDTSQQSGRADPPLPRGRNATTGRDHPHGRQQETQVTPTRFHGRPEDVLADTEVDTEVDTEDEEEARVLYTFPTTSKTRSSQATQPGHSQYSAARSDRHFSQNERFLTSRPPRMNKPLAGHCENRRVPRYYRAAEDIAAMTDQEDLTKEDYMMAVLQNQTEILANMNTATTARPEGRSHLPLMKVPIYTGRNQNVIAWIDDLRDYFAIMKVSFEEQATILPAALDGTAKRYYRSLPYRVTCDVEASLAAIKQHFWREQLDRAHQDIHVFQKPNQSVRSFVDELEKKFEEANIFDDRLMTNMFVPMLRTSLRKAVMMLGYRTFKEAVRHALQAEQTQAVFGNSDGDINPIFHDALDDWSPGQTPSSVAQVQGTQNTNGRGRGRRYGGTQPGRNYDNQRNWNRNENSEQFNHDSGRGTWSGQYNRYQNRPAQNPYNHANQGNGGSDGNRSNNQDYRGPRNNYTAPRNYRNGPQQKNNPPPLMSQNVTPTAAHQGRQGQGNMYHTTRNDQGYVFKGNCYNCGRQGHMSRDCRQSN